MESPCECGIELSGSISHEVSLIFYKFHRRLQIINIYVMAQYLLLYFLRKLTKFQTINFEYQIRCTKEDRLIKTCLYGTQNKVWIGNCFIVFPFGMGNALSPKSFNLALEYAIRKVQETSLRLDMNGTHQVLAYASYVSLIGDYINTIERNENVL